MALSNKRSHEENSAGEDTDRVLQEQDGKEQQSSRIRKYTITDKINFIRTLRADHSVPVYVVARNQGIPKGTAYRWLLELRNWEEKEILRKG